MRYFLILIALVLVVGCTTGGNQSKPETNLGDDARLRDLINKALQAERSATAENVGRDNNNINNDLSKGWGGIMAIAGLFVMMAGFILALCPTMKSWKVRWLLCAGACSSFIAAIYFIKVFYE